MKEAVSTMRQPLFLEDNLANFLLSGKSLNGLNIQPII